GWTARAPKSRERERRERPKRNCRSAPRRYEAPSARKRLSSRNYSSSERLLRRNSRIPISPRPSTIRRPMNHHSDMKSGRKANMILPSWGGGAQGKTEGGPPRAVGEGAGRQLHPAVA